MLHTKFRVIRPTGSGEEDFEGFLPYKAWRPSWSCDPDAANKLSFPLPMEVTHKNLALIGQAVWEKKMMRIVDRRTDDRRRMDA